MDEKEDQCQSEEGHPVWTVNKHKGLGKARKNEDEEDLCQSEEGHPVWTVNKHKGLGKPGRMRRICVRVRKVTQSEPVNKR